MERIDISRSAELVNKEVEKGGLYQVTGGLTDDDKRLVELAIVAAESLSRIAGVLQSIEDALHQMGVTR